MAHQIPFSALQSSASLYRLLLTVELHSLALAARSPPLAWLLEFPLYCRTVWAERLEVLTPARAHVEEAEEVQEMLLLFFSLLAVLPEMMAVR